MLALLGLLALLSLTVLASPAPPPVSATPSADDRADVNLYRAIVEGVRAGGNYYAVAAEQLRIGNYPLKPFVTMRLPTLALVQAALPPLAVTILLYLLALGVVVAWWQRLRAALNGIRPLAIATILLLGGLVVFVQAELTPFHEVWAGLLIALSLALRRPRRWIEAVAIGLIAMLIRETAALYVMVMLGMALIERQRREAIGWGAALLVFAAVVAVHAYAWSQVVRADDPVSPGWNAMLGFGFFVKAMELSTALHLAPEWLAALLAALALFGWASWRDPLALRALATLAGYAVLLSLFGRPDTFYWGLLCAGLLLPGLAFAPDGVRDTIAAALDRRRIIVTRRVQ